MAMHTNKKMHNNLGHFMISIVFILLAASSIMTQARADPVTKESQSTDADRVQIGVYIESLCPDSKRFVLNQLVPTYRLIGEIMAPDMIPFGHARTLGNDKMICQHGEQECKGNRRMACIQSRAKTMDEQIETIGCLFKNRDSLELCLKENMPNVTVSDIEQCTSSSESYNLMIEAEKKTGRVGYIPHLTMGNQTNPDLQGEMEFDLKNTICKNYNGTKPAACS